MSVDYKTFIKNILGERYKDMPPEAIVHSIHVCEMFEIVGTNMGLSKSELKAGKMAALLHDIGKSKIPPEIFYKPAGIRFTPEERLIVNRHPIDSYEMLKDTGFFSEEVMMLCLGHHASLGGSMYECSDGIKTFNASNMGLPQRILSVCDVFEALKSPRIYKDGFDYVTTCQKLDEHIHYGLLDEKVVDRIKSLYEAENSDLKALFETKEGKKFTHINLSQYRKLQSNSSAPVVGQIFKPEETAKASNQDCSPGV